jgi:hypothetical protein
MRLSPYYETMLGNPERGVESQLRQAAIVSIAAAGGHSKYICGRRPRAT